MHHIKLIPEYIKRIVSSPRFRRYAPLVIIALVAVVTFVTCIPGQAPELPPEPTHEPPEISETPPPPPPSPPPPPPSPEPPEEIEPDPPDTGPRNPLTGLPTEEDLSNNRPLAIVIGNCRDSQPQVGVSQADIIYEVLVEGDITRMLALYQDASEVGRIGSVRSARTYTVDIAQSYDAIFIFAGGSPQAYSAVRSRNITYLDDVTGVGSAMYFRDANRRAQLGFMHSLVTTGERIRQHMPTFGFRLQHAEGYERALVFAENGTPLDGALARDFTVRFGPNAKTTAFFFNEETGLYNLRQYGSAYLDGNDRTQIAVTNVLILRMATAGIPGDREGRLNITTTGSGTGYFACGGLYIPINWSRANESSQFIYTLEDGTELILGEGKTYICIIRSNMDVDFS